jgi:protoporphyrinogen/coproporphyrinogen III oxidase
VVGAGIAGLAAAFRLRELSAAMEMPLEVALFERTQRLGSALETIHRDGFVIETGADSFLSEKPWAVDLARRIGLESELISTNDRFRKTYVVRAGRLIEIPEGFSLLAPARVGPFLRSPLLSPAGKLRVMIEPLIPRRREVGDESLGSFVRRRLGREVLERVAQPLAGGIYTADPERLSLEATMPRFLDMERRYGSVIRGLMAANRTRLGQAAGTSGARWTLFLSFRGGMGALAEKLGAHLGECARTGTEVVELVRVPEGDKWKLLARDGRAFEADAVVLAAPAYAAARMLRNHDARLADLLNEISYSSAATVNLAYRASDLPRMPETFGFVVPAQEHRKIIACSFSSNKFAGRAPESGVLIRAFLGGVLQKEMMHLDDAAMAAAARDELQALLGVDAAPVATWVRRWPDSMPQYDVGHLGRVAEIERRARDLPGVAFAGSAYRGVGIPDCVRSGEQAAEAVLTYLNHRA